MSPTKQSGGIMTEINPGSSDATSTSSARTLETQESKKKEERRPVGRPQKRRGHSFGGGRKKKQKGEAISVSLEQKTAQDIVNKILEENDILVVGRITRMLNRKKEKEEKFWRKLEESEKKKLTGRHSKESALAFFLEYGFTRKQYSALVEDTILRTNSTKTRNIYPSYSVLNKAKQECLALEILSSDRSIRTPLQQLVNKTGERLCKSVASGWSEIALKGLKLIFLGSFGISSGVTNSQQESDDAADEFDDAQKILFVTSVTPLQMISKSKVGSDEHEWHNPTPASYRYCRPVRIALGKLNAETISDEYERLTAETKEIKNHKFTLKNGKKVTITFQFRLATSAGECGSNFSRISNGPATQRCQLCLRTTHEFGNQGLSFLVKKEPHALDLTITLLQAERKIFDNLVYISHRKNSETSSKTQDINDDFESYRENVIKCVKKSFGVRHGTINTSTLDRICFKDPQKFARALGLDENFVQQLADILTLFKTNQRADYDMLEDYCWRVYWDHYKLHEGALVDVTIHELLIHGCKIARESAVPVCYFSEDGRELWHKFHRRNITKSARQCSEGSQLLELYHSAMYESDPLISNILLDERLKLLEKKNFPKRLEKYIIKSDGDETISNDEDDNSSDVSSSEETTSSDSDLSATKAI